MKLTESKLLVRINLLKHRCEELENENRQLKESAERYVREFRVCRFCKFKHADCSPTDGSCTLAWGGL